MTPTTPFPFKAPRVALALTIGVPYTATNRNHNLQISLTHDQEDVALGVATRRDNADSEPVEAAIKKLGAQFNMGRPPFLHPGDPQIIPFAVNMDGLHIERPGEYSFVIQVDDEELSRLVFRVLDVQGGTISATGLT